jgi:hypothetical protein
MWSAGGRRQSLADEPMSARAGDQNQTCPVCACCGIIVGVFEPMWMELTDGTLRPSSLLNVAGDTPMGETCTRMWHFGCLAPDEIPAPRPRDDGRSSV